VNLLGLVTGLRIISPAELERLRQEQPVTIIDVNARASWLEAHVPGALNLDPATFEAVDLPPGRDATLVFYCSNPLCQKAPNAARRAGKMGYENVRVLSAGIRGWLASGLPTERGE
jgi:rhodanese-related sulfurtransferase